MKAFNSFLALLAIPALVSPVYATNAAGPLSDYLPSDGSLIQGAAVRTTLDPSIVPFNKKIMENFNKLPEEKRAELAKGIDGNKAFPYDEAVFGDKETYSQYMEAWKKTRLVPMAAVAMGLLKSDTKDVWQVYSVTKDAAGKPTPLTVSTFKYDSARNVWISDNGELTATPFSADETFIFGAQSGTEWSVERGDSLSKLKETVRVTKATNGSAVFVYYFFMEKSAISGATLARGEYMLYFPIVTESAGLSKPGQK